jgi:NADPH-dependent curcumin reductase CurA
MARIGFDKSLGIAVIELSSKLDSIATVQGEIKEDQKELREEMRRIDEKTDNQYQDIAKQINRFRQDTLEKTGDQNVAIKEGDLALGARVAKLEDTSVAAWEKIDDVAGKLNFIIAALGDKEDWKKIKTGSAHGEIAYKFLAMVGAAALFAIVGLIVAFAFRGGFDSQNKAKSVDSPTAVPSVYRYTK